MAKVGSFLHDSFVDDDVAAIDTAFNVARVHVHNLYAGTYISGNRFKDRIESIIVRLKTIAGGAAKVTIRLCMDAAGDYTIVPDTEADLAFGVTTATLVAQQSTTGHQSIMSLETTTLSTSL
jgi:hypothetical protein